MFKNVDGKQVLIGLLGERDIFGEIAFLGKTKRTVSVIADGDAIVEMITRDTFMYCIDKLPRNVQARLCTMAIDLTRMSEIYCRLVVLLQNRHAETKILNMNSFETEIEKIPEFMRRVVATVNRRHGGVVEGLNILSSQLEKKQSGPLNN